MLLSCRFRCLCSAAVTLASFAFSSSIQAAEASLVSGFYRTEKDKVGGEDAGKKSTIDLGGRFGEALDAKLAWFGQGMLSLKSYDGGRNSKSPSDSTSLSAGGGLRRYFAKIDAVNPYVYGLVQFKDDKDAEQGVAGFTEKESSGLFYGASFGLRFALDSDFFVDFETPLFESALFATDKTEETTIDVKGVATKVKSEKTRTELYVNSTGAFQQVLVALGVHF